MVICLTLFVLMMVSLAMNKVPMGVTGLALNLPIAALSFLQSF